MEDKNRKYEPQKLGIEGKTWHLEFLFDAPIVKEFVFNGTPITKSIFAFRDIDTDKNISVMFSDKTTVASKLKDYRRGDKIDITYKPFVDKLGVPKHFYDILPYGMTQHTNGPLFKTPETIVEIGKSDDGIDLSTIEF